MRAAAPSMRMRAMETLEFLVEAGNAGQRLDRFLAERELGLTRNALQQLI